MSFEAKDLNESTMFQKYVSADNGRKERVECILNYWCVPTALRAHKDPRQAPYFTIFD